MQLTRPLPGLQRGRPVWHALVTLVLLPVLTAAALCSLSVLGAVKDAARAADAQARVAAVTQLDEVRRAIDAEVLPTLLMAVLDDEAGAAAVGFPADRRAVLLATESMHLEALRSATDDALHAAVQTPRSAEVVPAAAIVSVELSATRKAADAGSSSVEGLADTFDRLSSLLATAQRRSSAEALAADLSTTSALALQDLTQTLMLGQLASRQLPLLFASRVLPGAAGEQAHREWLASWGAYTDLAGRNSDLSSRRVRAAWDSALAIGTVDAFSDLLDRQALDPRSDVLVTGALPGLVASSEARDAAIGVALVDAARLVTTAAGADRAAAAERRTQIGGICLALLLASLAEALLVARWLARSLGALAASAQQISHGSLVDVPVRGPRELRTAARALSATVAGLRRVREQAGAVAAGDLELALRFEPLPGPLGEVVHASVQQVVRVVQAREELQEELTHRAAHDALTGLANRAQALMALTGALGSGDRPDRRTGLLFLDLDGFKTVNDTHGHAVGDALLRVVADRLTATVRGGDVVGRLGGDEFVVVVQDAPGADSLLATGERLVSVLSQPVSVQGEGGRTLTVRVGASVGVASSLADGRATADALLAEADAAAYRAKRLGRGRVELFDDALREELATHLCLEEALRAGIARGELVLHYQPVVDVATGEALGYEALVRWQRPGHGLVGPDVFVPVAEASSLVCDLGRWVLGEATAQLARWLSDDAGSTGVTVAVNLSARHLLDPRVVDDVVAALRAAGLPATALVVEITETVLVDDPQVALHLGALRALGVRVAIDDFGTGFTSIAALSTTPADILKVDRSFVATDDPGRRQLATLMVRAARTFDMEVVAEGVETLDQLARVTADGCATAQGWLFSRALPAHEVTGYRSPLALEHR